MILTHLAVSTRIVALAAMLLIPAWGWASPNTLDDMLGSVKAGDTLLFMPGVYDKNNPPVLAPKDFQCLVRMRKAMAVLDDIITRQWVQTFAGVNAYETIFNSVADRAQWTQTMADCVK